MNTLTSFELGPFDHASKPLATNFNFELEGKDLWEATKIPFICKDVKIFSPGKHSGQGGTFEYTEESIKYAFENTDWNDQTTAIYLEHRDEYTYDPVTMKKTKPTGADARDWAGFAKNQRYVNGHILGDLWIYDKQTAVKIAAGAKLGISPRGSGKHVNGKVMNMLIENYSITVNPAIKTTYFNFAMSELSEYDKPTMDEDIKQVLDSLASNQEKVSASVDTLSASVKDMQAKMAEEPDPKEDEEKKKKEEEEAAKKEKEDEMAEAEKKLSEELKENFLKFQSNYKEKNPDASDSDVKKAYSELGEGEDTPPADDKSDEDKDKDKDKKPDENKDDEKKKEEELSELKEKVKSLETKLREPDVSKSASIIGSDDKITELSEGSDEGMMKFLQHNFLGGGVLTD